MVCARIPALGKKGDQVLAFNRLTALVNAGYKVTLIHIVGLDKDESILKKEIENLGVRVHVIKISYLESLLHMIKTIFNSKLPMQTAIYKSTAFKREVIKIVNSERISAVHCIGIRVSQNIPIPIHNGKLWFEFIDSMALNFHARRNATRSLIIRWLLNVEHTRLLKYEKAVAKHSCHSFVVAAKDRDYIGSKNLAVIQLGLDLSRYLRERKQDSNRFIVFSGNMSYAPNVISTLWFVKNCWQKVKNSVPDVKFFIVGRDPSVAIRKLSRSDNRIVVTGSVDDMGDILARSTVAIAPMQAGSGMQLKILEAMACSVPVLTTTLGLGDIDAHIDEEIKVADDPDMFSQTLIHLCGNRSLNYSVGESGNTFLKNNHCRENINLQFIDLIKGLKEIT